MVNRVTVSTMARREWLVAQLMLLHDPQGMPSLKPGDGTVEQTAARRRSISTRRA